MIRAPLPHASKACSASKEVNSTYSTRPNEAKTRARQPAISCCLPEAYDERSVTRNPQGRSEKSRERLTKAFRIRRHPNRTPFQREITRHLLKQIGERVSAPKNSQVFSSTNFNGADRRTRSVRPVRQKGGEYAWRPTPSEGWIWGRSE